MRLTDLGRGEHLWEGVDARGLPTSHRLGVGDGFSVGDFTVTLESPESTAAEERSCTVPGPADELGLRGPAELVLGRQQWALDPSHTLRLGSAADNDIVLKDRFVSAHHCVFEAEARGWRIRDLGSTNGTRLDGVSVRNAYLAADSRLAIGSGLFRIRPRHRESAPPTRNGIVAASNAMHAVLDALEGFARSDEPVSIIGASGTGKEGLARAVHELSPRATSKMLALNCSTLSEHLVEAELFGHVKGAFTGADTTKAGAFRAADGGTLFLDEVGELPLAVQPKLLRVLESGTVRPVGGTQEEPVDVRIVCATHRDLAAMVREGRFREDLYHRLVVLSLRVPPLSERPEDIRALSQHFLRLGRHRRALSDEALERLLAHPWPGNARELRNVLVRSAFLATGPRIEAEDLQFDLRTSATPDEPTSQPTAELPRGRVPLERAAIEAALRETGGNQAEAARRLGVCRSTFHDRVRKLGIQPRRADLSSRRSPPRPCSPPP